MKAKIENVYNNLSKVDKKIADYFLVNANNILSMNIHELSAAIGTSSASVSRFVRRVFGKNFAQTKIEIAKSIENKKFLIGQLILMRCLKISYLILN